MSEYTSTHEGFQRAMKWALTGKPEEAKDYVEATTMPGFYQVVNDHHLPLDQYTKNIAEWRGKTSDYNPTVTDFVRDGDRLAARMTGTIKLNGEDTKFEANMFAKVDPETGKMLHLTERAVWGLVGAEMYHGVTGLARDH